MHMLAGYDPAPPQHLNQAAGPAHTPPHSHAAISSPRLILSIYRSEDYYDDVGD